MKRRALLRATAGAAGLMLASGCTAFGRLGDDVPDGDPEPELPPDEQLREVLEGEWGRGDPDAVSAPMIGDAESLAAFERDPDDGATVERVEADSRVETAGRAILAIWVHGDSGGARERYDDHPDQRRRFDDADVALEAIVGGASPAGKHPQARVLFRDANAVGWVSYWSLRQSSPAEYETTALELAETVHDRWYE